MKSNSAKGIISGFALMLASAYFDNLRGPLLPVLRRVFSLSYGQTSWFLVTGQLTSVLCMFALIPLSRRFGTMRLSCAVCVLGFLTALVAPLVDNYIFLIAYACFLGISISALGAMANLQVMDATRAENRARFFCGVHMMYGVGSMLGPSLCAILLTRDYSWSTLLMLNAPLLATIAVFTLTPRLPRLESSSAPVHYVPVVWTARHGLTLLLFGAYVAGEVLTSSWLVVYLVEHVGLTVEKAAPYVSGFFILMGVSRGSCFLLIRPRWERAVLGGCLLAGAAAFLTGRAGWLIGFSLVGVVGPFFPLLMTRMSRDFPRESGTMALWVLTTMYLTLSVCHLSVGYFTDRVGIASTYWLPLFFLASSLVGLGLYFQGELPSAEPAG